MDRFLLLKKEYNDIKKYYIQEKGSYQTKEMAIARAKNALESYSKNRKLLKEQIKKAVGSIPQLDSLIDFLEEYEKRVPKNKAVINSIWISDCNL